MVAWAAFSHDRISWTVDSWRGALRSVGRFSCLLTGTGIPLRLLPAANQLVFALHEELSHHEF